MVIYKSGYALEQYSKIKFTVKQSVRWLEHMPCLFISMLLFLNIFLRLHVLVAFMTETILLSF